MIDQSLLKDMVDVTGTDDDAEVYKITVRDEQGNLIVLKYVSEDLVDENIKRYSKEGYDVKVVQI